MKIYRALVRGIFCTISIFVTFAIFSTTVDACEWRYPEANDNNRTRHVGLSARWPDAQILQNLRLQIDRAEVKQTESKDALKTEYGYFGRWVTITRSVKNGAEVQLLEQGRDKLVWKLGSC